MFDGVLFDLNNIRKISKMSVMYKNFPFEDAWTSIGNVCNRKIKKFVPPIGDHKEYENYFRDSPKKRVTWSNTVATTSLDLSTERKFPKSCIRAPSVFEDIDEVSIFPPVLFMGKRSEPPVIRRFLLLYIYIGRLDFGCQSHLEALWRTRYNPNYRPDVERNRREAKRCGGENEFAKMCLREAELMDLGPGRSILQRPQKVVSEFRNVWEVTLFYNGQPYISIYEDKEIAERSVQKSKNLFTSTFNDLETSEETKHNTYKWYAYSENSKCQICIDVMLV